MVQRVDRVYRCARVAIIYRIHRRTITHRRDWRDWDECVNVLEMDRCRGV